MKRKSVLGMLALIILMASFGEASAFRGNFFGIDSESRDTIVNAIMSERQVQREAMEKAVQDGNYMKLRELSE